MEAECSVSMTNRQGSPKTGMVGSEGKQNWDLSQIVNRTQGGFREFTVP